MKKLLLDVGALEVQSFATSHSQGARGTVWGAESVEYPQEPLPSRAVDGCESGSCLGTREDCGPTFITCPNLKHPCLSGFPSDCDLTCVWIC
jgi:hypothetical protein